ncbi:hypothetical protein BVI434_1230005 [Burkholderia vietnamiensis]|nr:hypothetical protein BVI434_1230005 [Burkholderia vietnamiensis]
MKLDDRCARIVPVVCGHRANGVLEIVANPASRMGANI